MVRAVKSIEKYLKNQCKFGAGQKASKNPTKINFGRVLGCIWEGFGAVLGLLWVLLAVSRKIKKQHFGKINVFCPQNWLRKGFWMDLGSLWEGFEEVLGGFGEKFWRILGLLNT